MEDNNMKMMEMSGNSTAKPPMSHGMPMSFTTSCHVMPLLFSSLNIHSCSSLAGACACVFVLAVLYEGLKVFREHLMLTMVKVAKSSVAFVKECTCGGTNKTTSVADIPAQHDHTTTCPQSTTSPFSGPHDKDTTAANKMFSSAHFIQSFLHTVQLSVAYILMLVVMTYNVYLFLAVIAGSGVGYFVFAWMRKTVGSTLDEEHCH